LEKWKPCKIPNAGKGHFLEQLTEMPGIEGNKRFGNTNYKSVAKVSDLRINEIMHGFQFQNASFQKLEKL
jgi:hypothetical protein